VSEILFRNSCGIMGRVPVSPDGQKTVNWTNDGPETIRITAVEYSDGVSAPRSVSVFVPSGRSYLDIPPQGAYLITFYEVMPFSRRSQTERNAL
jgi:hypothetical protein